MDWSNFVPVILGIIITILPLIRAKLRCGNISHPHLEADLGKEQVYIEVAPAGETVIGLIKTSPGAHIKIISNDFKKWRKGEKFYEFISQQLDKGVKVTAYGIINKKDIKTINSIHELMEKGLKVIRLTTFLLEHYLIVDNPRQLWAERIHKGYYAHDCIYTDSPHDDVWNDVVNYFQKIDEQSQLYIPEKRTDGNITFKVL